MKTLTDRLYDYLDVRRALGYKLDFCERVLRKFTQFADDLGQRHISVDLFLAWKDQYGNADSNTWSRRLGMVRSFATWLQGIDGRSEVPPSSLMTYRAVRPKPSIFSEQQIRDLVAEAARLPSEYGFRGLTASTLFGLIAVTGLRINEALGLDEADIDLSLGTLDVTKTKNGYDRRLPIAPCTVDRLRHYIDQRRRLIGVSGGAVFVTSNGRRLGDCGARYNFAQVGQRLGYRPKQRRKRHGIGPRIHDLRHTFAVRTIIDWYKADLDVDREMYKLTAFLGHKKPQHTYWYIEAVPELLELASKRSERLIKRRRP